MSTCTEWLKRRSSALTVNSIHRVDLARVLHIFSPVNHPGLVRYARWTGELFCVIFSLLRVSAGLQLRVSTGARSFGELPGAPPWCIARRACHTGPLMDWDEILHLQLLCLGPERDVILLCGDIDAVADHVAHSEEGGDKIILN